ncbi:MAG: glycosyltransferase [Elusimicrobiales bacterium]
MKILLATCRNPHFATITEYIEWAITGNSHQLDFFDDRAFLLPGRLRDALPALACWDMGRINKALENAVLRGKPDLVLVAGGYRISGATVRRLRAAGIKTALWTIDAFMPPELAAAAPEYDFVFCGGTEALDLLRSRGLLAATWLPFGFARGFHKPQPPSGESCDVCFVGSHYPAREKLLEAIANMPVKLRISGPGWNKLRPGSPLRATARQVPPEEWMHIYAGAKIVLCAAHQPAEYACHQASPRIFEALATRSFLLTDAQRDVLALFREGEHMAVFRTAAELREKITYYLSHDAQRLSIARAGHEFSLSRHSYHDRINLLADIVSGVKKRGEAYY